MNNKNVKIIPFRDLLKCRIPSHEEDIEILESDSRKPFFYMFYLYTKERLYQLYTTTKHERFMWTTCLDIIISMKEEVLG